MYIFREYCPGRYKIYMSTIYKLSVVLCSWITQCTKWTLRMRLKYNPNYRRTTNIRIQSRETNFVSKYYHLHLYKGGGKFKVWLSNNNVMPVFFPLYHPYRRSIKNGTILKGNFRFHQLQTLQYIILLKMYDNNQKRM